MQSKMQSNDNQDVYASYLFDPITKSNKINKRIYTVLHSGLAYEILTYDKHFLCDKGAPKNITQCRSVIFSHPEHKLLSFSPPKSITIDEFYKKYPQGNNVTDMTDNISDNISDITNISDIICANEMVEGTLLHLFYDNRNQSWEIATKNAIGGQYKLFQNKSNSLNSNSQPTVYRMFLDALRSPPSTDINHIPTIQNLSQQYSYSFVLQHPKNPIILPIKYPELYLVAVYDVFGPLHNGLRAIAIPPPVFQQWPAFYNTTILFPAMVDLSAKTLDNLNKDNLSMGKKSSMGTMIINTRTGDRCSILNPEYTNALQCRNVNPGHLYQFLCLLRIGRVKDYLQHFSKQKVTCSKFDALYQTMIEDIHSAYMNTYVYRKNNVFYPSLAKYQPIIQRLHKKIYLPSLSKHKRPINEENSGQNNGHYNIKITPAIVRDFIYKMEPREQIDYLINCFD